MDSGSKYILQESLNKTKTIKRKLSMHEGNLCTWPLPAKQLLLQAEASEQLLASRWLQFLEGLPTLNCVCFCYNLL